MFRYLMDHLQQKLKHERDRFGDDTVQKRLKCVHWMVHSLWWSVSYTVWNYSVKKILIIYITRIIFLKWFIMFYIITTLLQSALLLTRYTCTNQRFSHYWKHFWNSSVLMFSRPPTFTFSLCWPQQKFPFHLTFHTRKQDEFVWCKVRWIGKMRDSRHTVFCQKMLHTQGRVGRGIVVVKEPITAAPRVWPFFPYTIA